MSVEGIGLQLVPLVPNVELPRPASARTRELIPPGYGVQEQCLPFTAASSLGFLIPSPIRFGYCPPGQVPQGCRAFSSPISSASGDSDWTFYVEDDPGCRFSGNAYSFSDIPRYDNLLEPGISFFDRPDQQDLFKLHLPYIWRTPDLVDTLFSPLINGPRSFEVQSGLVETDWYSNPVNLILKKLEEPIHFSQGQLVAQAILISRSQRRPTLQIAASHSRLARDTRQGLATWYDQHAKERSAYKMLARSRHGRLDS